MIGNTSKTDQRVLNAQKVIGLLAITAISEVSDSVITAPNRFRGRGEEGQCAGNRPRAAKFLELTATNEPQRLPLAIRLTVEAKSHRKPAHNRFLRQSLPHRHGKSTTPTE